MRANWGGKRPGAGRKRQRSAARVISHPSSSLPEKSAIVPPTTNEPSPVEEFDAPDDLTADERAVWLKQAPHAFKARTLTRQTALSFERYCKVVVLERNEAKSSGVGGPNHRGLLKQLQAYELYFMLMPQGKPMSEPAPAPQSAADDNDAFFGDARGRG